jgi:hypothetical protein
MCRENEDRILAAAEEIKAKRAGNDTPDGRYRARMSEFAQRSAAGESLEAIQASWQTPSPN